MTTEEDYVRFDFVLKDWEARRAEGAPLVPFQLNVSDDAQGVFGVLPDDFEASQPRPVETDRLTFLQVPLWRGVPIPPLEVDIGAEASTS